MPTFRLCWPLMLLAAAACESFTEVPGPTPYGATLSGGAVRPTNVATDGRGTLAATLHPRNEALSYALGWSDLASDATGAHLHGPASTSGVAGILVDLAALPQGSTGAIDLAAGTATGDLDLTAAITATVSGDSLLALLNAGQLYVDVHTVSRPDGEIRGQLARR